MEEKISFRPMDNLAHDVPASIVVFLVALPLCLGIALASGAPLFSGLVAGIVGGVVAGLISRSPVSVSGPAAGLTTIVLASITELGSFSLFLSCVIIAGLIQIALGFIKAGTIGHFFPIAVVKGMLAAIGLILILKQVPHALGYDVDFEGDENFLQPDGENTFSEIISAAGQLSPGAIVVCGISLAILYFWTQLALKKIKWISYFPAPLVVVLLGIGLNYFFQEFVSALEIRESHLVSLPDFSGFRDVGQFLTLPDFNGLLNPRIYVIAITLALVASLETLLSIEAVDKLDPLRRITPLNHELKSQGVTNVISGLMGGLPVTSVIVRSSANVHAGARTKTSAILHGVLLAFVVLAMPDVLKKIPLASLAAILLVLGYKLTTPELYREMYGKGKVQFLPFIITIISILLTNLLAGIFIGILVSVFFVLKTNFKSAIILVNSDSQYLLKFTKDVSFVHKSILRNALEKIPDGASLMIDGSKSQFLDADIVETIDDFIKSAVTRNITVEIKKTHDAMHPLFRKDNGPLKRNGIISKTL